ncbi:hypothetical protein EJ05DRAFT_517090 [Pseudovirgaria hyperparasitica]|uniref:Uncharacterized protein n=1 Tax=Pseudovirgaria hyperparasitica TaxID=470096 RepID=A0A6A6WMW9_9PEZI|nr:uncharacterized protein EJ05DRAFT_517090 [Pseudovirgaria hyperparasitica]KAF2763575.1 hypothetical protein EJ05DRAFT_517090 [Pseudovirgaria hyperparasitica]
MRIFSSMLLFGVFFTSSLAAGTYALHKTCTDEYPRLRYILLEAQGMARLATESIENWDEMSDELKHGFEFIFERRSFNDGIQDEESKEEESPGPRVTETPRMFRTMVSQIFKRVDDFQETDWESGEIHIYCNEDRWRELQDDEQYDDRIRRHFPNGSIPVNLRNSNRLPNDRLWIDRENGYWHRGPPECSHSSTLFGRYEDTPSRGPYGITITWCAKNWPHGQRFLIDLLLEQEDFSTTTIDNILSQHLSPVFLYGLLLTPRFDLREMTAGWAGSKRLSAEEALINIGSHVLFGLLSFLNELHVFIDEKHARLGYLVEKHD